MTQDFIFTWKWVKLNHFMTFELISRAGHSYRGQNISVRIQNGVQMAAFRHPGKWLKNAFTLAPCITKNFWQFNNSL